MRVFTVKELNLYVKGILDKDPLLSNIWVKGEISNFKRAVSGHLYFTLKDQSGCIKAVMFRSRSRNLIFQPENGMAVRARGYVSVFDRDGIYQLYIDEMEPDGTGALYLAFEQLKEKLQQEGLFDPCYKKKIPLIPGSIGIVTSPTGAVIRDMVGIIRRRWPGVEIILVPVAVQGEAAPREIARGIGWLNQLDNIDVIIIGRGGGSLEELWAFNTEIVARSIFLSQIPVISAVGHETDFTISDMAADVRAATPSAAAELVVPVKYEMERYLQNLYGRMRRAMAEDVGRYQKRLETCLKSRVMRNPVDSICGTRQQALDLTARRLIRSMEHFLEQGSGRLAVAAGRLQALSPLATLSRGYSICMRPEKKGIVRNAGDVAVGDSIEVELHRGRLKCMVEECVPD